MQELESMPNIVDKGDTNVSMEVVDEKDEGTLIQTEQLMAMPDIVDMGSTNASTNKKEIIPEAMQDRRKVRNVGSCLAQRRNQEETRWPAVRPM